MTIIRAISLPPRLATWVYQTSRVRWYTITAPTIQNGKIYHNHGDTVLLILSTMSYLQMQSPQLLRVYKSQADLAAITIRQAQEAEKKRVRRYVSFYSTKSSVPSLTIRCLGSILLRNFFL